MFLPLQAGVDVLATPQGKLLVAVVTLALVVLLGRFVLNVAWRLLKIATVVIGLIWLLSVVAPQVMA